MEGLKKIKQKISMKNIPTAPHYNTLNNLNFKVPPKFLKKPYIIKKRNSSFKSIKTENNSFISPPSKNFNVKRHKRHKSFSIINYSNILSKSTKLISLNKIVLNQSKIKKKNENNFMRNLDEQNKNNIKEASIENINDLSKIIKENIKDGIKEGFQVYMNDLSKSIKESTKNGIKEGLQVYMNDFKESMENGIIEIQNSVKNIKEGFSQFQENFFNYSTSQKDENGGKYIIKIEDSNGKKKEQEENKNIGKFFSSKGNNLKDDSIKETEKHQKSNYDDLKKNILEKSEKNDNSNDGNRKRNHSHPK